MINLATVMKGVQFILENYADFSNYTVTRGEYINTDPGIENWIGVYKAKVKYSPQTLGRGAPQNWKTQLEIKVIVQAFGIEGYDVDSELDSKVQKVLTAINADRTLNSTIATIIGYEVDYSYEESEESSIPFQNATISILGETRS